MEILLGRFDGTVGAKHRTAFPKKFRDILGDRLIVTKGFEECLVVVSQENWKTLLEGTEGKPFTNKNTRELQRFLFGNAAEIVLDTLRRFVLPDYLLDYAGIKDEIVYVGMNRYIEIWDKKQWDEHQKELSETAPSIAERLESKDNG